MSKYLDCNDLLPGGSIANFNRGLVIAFVKTGYIIPVPAGILKFALEFAPIQNVTAASRLVAGCVTYGLYKDNHRRYIEDPESLSVRWNNFYAKYSKEYEAVFDRNNPPYRPCLTIEPNNLFEHNQPIAYWFTQMLMDVKRDTMMVYLVTQGLCKQNFNLLLIAYALIKYAPKDVENKTDADVDLDYRAIFMTLVAQATALSIEEGYCRMPVGIKKDVMESLCNGERLPIDTINDSVVSVALDDVSISLIRVTSGNNSDDISRKLSDSLIQTAHERGKTIIDVLDDFYNTVPEASKGMFFKEIMSCCWEHWVKHSS